jgi:hypothetical protein
MIAGWTISQLVQYIQEDEGEAQEMPSQNLFKLLEGYRKTIPPGEFLSKQPPPDIVQQRMSKVHKTVIDKLKKGLNELEELHKLYDTQLERIGIDLEAEKTNGKLFPSMSNEVRIAKEILESSSRLKQELGLTKKHLGQIDVETRFIADAADRYGEGAKRVLQNPESRRKVLSLAERFLSLEAPEEKKEEEAEEEKPVVAEASEA